MIHSIYVVNAAGETQAAINRGTFDMDDALFGGFLSAIQMYSQKVSGQEMSELVLEDYKILITKTSSAFLVTVHDDGDTNAAAANERVAKVLDGLVNDIITDDTIELLKKAAEEEKSGQGSALDWASKVL